MTQDLTPSAEAVAKAESLKTADGFIALHFKDEVEAVALALAAARLDGAREAREAAREVFSPKKMHDRLFTRGEVLELLRAAEATP